MNMKKKKKMKKKRRGDTEWLNRLMKKKKKRFIQEKRQNKLFVKQWVGIDDENGCQRRLIKKVKMMLC